MAQIRAEKVWKNKEKMDGSKYIDKYGKEYTFLKVLSEGRYIVVWGLTEPQIEMLQDGDVIEGELETGEFNGNPSYSIRVPKANSETALRNEILDKDEKIKELELQVAHLIESGGKEEEFVKEVPVDEIPF